MRENATLHFDLSHLAPGRPLTLYAGRESCSLQRHTPQTLARARRDTKVLRLIKDRRITHYAQPRRLPSNAPLLLRVTTPPRNPDELLDRLTLVRSTCHAATARPRSPATTGGAHATRAPCRRTRSSSPSAIRATLPPCCRATRTSSTSAT